MKVHTGVGALALFGLSMNCLGQSGGPSVTHPVELVKGVVIEQVSKSSEAEKVGIEPGDILLNWTRDGVHGLIESPFDLAYLRFEQAPLGRVTLKGLRRNQRREWKLGSDVWGIAASPILPKSISLIYRDGLKLLAAGNPKDAAALWQSAIEPSKQLGVPWLAAWFLTREGQALFVSDWDSANSAYRESILLASDAGPVVRAEIYRQWASGFEYYDDLPHAEQAYERMLAEWQKLGSDTAGVSNAMLSLAVVELKRGEDEKAEALLNDALAIAEKIAPSSLQMTVILANLAVLAQQRGDFLNAEKYYFKALASEERNFPHSIHLARTFTNLGTLFHQSGDLTRAGDFYQRALAIEQKLVPRSLEFAGVLRNLSDCFLDEHKLPKADKYAMEALAINENNAAGSLSTAFSLAILGRITKERGDDAKAAEYYEQALAIAKKVQAPPRDVARFLSGEADVFQNRGNFSKAEELYGQALKILEKAAPGSIDRDEALADLAGTLRQAGELNAAATLYEQSLEALEKKAKYLPALGEERSRFRANQARYYNEYMDVLLRQGKPELAFGVLERSRARTMLEVLAGGNVDIRQGADPVLLERERFLRHQLSIKSEYRIHEADNPHAVEPLKKVNRELANLETQYQEVEAKLRNSSPTYAALTQPRSLTVREIQSLLDPDTLLLEYSLGDDRSYVWAVTVHSLVAYQLPKRADIEQAARRVYDLLTVGSRRANAGRADGGGIAQQYDSAARRLSGMILSPVGRCLKGKRLLIVADGALQYIPFSALPAPGQSTSPVPLIVNHEIVNLPSASVLAELRRQHLARQQPTMTVAVLADPVFDRGDERVKIAYKKLVSSVPSTGERDGDLVRSADDLGLTRGGKLHLSRLVYTRLEAQAIKEVSPPGRATVSLDFEANLRRATSETLSKYSIVHFATHGILNNRHPELSGLVFSLVNEHGKPEDGFLKLEDIYNLNLPVDLVVLSGCETGLGEEVEGEGLIGLTRGFMYAGATRVIASLWNVSDMATARLMATFYIALERDRLAPGAALRQAQIHMLRQTRWSSPYFWAAFQIQGDWR